MIDLYSLNGAWPDALPFRVNLPNSVTRTDPTTFTQEELASWGYVGPIAPPTYDLFTEVLEWDGSAFTIRPMTSEERQAVLDTKWSEVRIQRNRYLADTDWTQLPDSPTDKSVWATYRQALRDITQQDDPFNIVWPVLP